ncbi:MAG TPA: NadS family protein [Roseiarcus sp.]|jgi:putative transcriptional regulator
MTKFGEDLIQSAQEALAIAKGEIAPARVYNPKSIDVIAIRKKLGLSQQKFAERFGLSPAMVRDWEQKRRNPDQAARTLLTVIARDPEAVERALTS